MRRFLPPPLFTAYFSNRRHPGVVLRVSRILARLGMPLTAAANRAVAVATPESRCTKLSATRSALNNGSRSDFRNFQHRLARPGKLFTVARQLLDFDLCRQRAKRDFGKLMPAAVNGSRAFISATPDMAFAGTVARVVTSPGPEVFGQGGADGPTHLRSGKFHVINVKLPGSKDAKIVKSRVRSIFHRRISASGFIFMISKVGFGRIRLIWPNLRLLVERRAYARPELAPAGILI